MHAFHLLLFSLLAFAFVVGRGAEGSGLLLADLFEVYLAFLVGDSENVASQFAGRIIQLRPHLLIELNRPHRRILLVIGSINCQEKLPALTLKQRCFFLCQLDKSITNIEAWRFEVECGILPVLVPIRPVNVLDAFPQPFFLLFFVSDCLIVTCSLTHFFGGGDFFEWIFLRIRENTSGSRLATCLQSLV